MFRTLCVAAVILMSPPVTNTFAQTPASSKWTRQHIREMRAQWRSNRGRLKICRAEVKKKGLVDDERWFFMEECMSKS